MKLKQHEIYAALFELIQMIEACGCSPKLTNAVVFANDLMQAAGNRWNPANEYAAKRVFDVLGPLDPESEEHPTNGLETFQAFCELFMCDDPTILEDYQRELLEIWANEEARKLGFKDWVEAYHFSEETHEKPIEKQRQIEDLVREFLLEEGGDSLELVEIIRDVEREKLNKRK